jgi:HD-like signal output (HDOD) protein
LRHGAGVYSVLQILSRLTGKEFPESVFSAAWVHDIGKVALGAKIDALMTDQIQRRQTEAGISPLEAEQELLGTDHAQIGMVMLQRWQFPGEVWELVRRHHDLNPPHEAALDALHFANTLIGHLERKDHSNRKNRMDPELLGRLGLSPAAISQLTARTEEVLRRLDPWLVFV